MRLKVLLVLSVFAGSIVLADYLVERNVVLPKFIELERQQGYRNVDRVEEALRREVQDVSQNTCDYARWDDTCQFIEKGNGHFVQSNLTPQIFRSLHLNLIHFYDGTGKLKWGEMRDGESLATLTIPEIPTTGFPLDSFLLHPTRADDHISGLLRFGDRIMFVGSAPIVSSNGTGPIRGTVVFGRLLDKAGLARLQRQTHVQFTILPETPDASFAASGDATQGSGQKEPRVLFDESRSDRLLAYAPLTNITGSPIGWIEADVNREISAQGNLVISDEVWWMGMCSLAILAASYLGVGYLVVRPIQRFIRHITWIRQSGDLNQRIGNHSNDELGTLASEFDLLLSQMARSRTLRLRSESRLTAILQDQTDMIRRFTPDGTTTYVNRAYARYLGKPEESLVGRKSEMPMPPEEHERILAQLALLNAACPVAETEHRVVRPNGAIRCVHWILRAICDDEGNVTEYQTVGHEIRESPTLMETAPIGDTDGGNADDEKALPKA
jgi:PAS domain S-box-containing protein